MSSLHHENILEECFEVAMESFRINNKLTHEQLDELITLSIFVCIELTLSATLNPPNNNSVFNFSSSYCI